MQIVLLVRDDQKVNFEMTKRSILHLLDQKVNLLQYLSMNMVINTNV